MHERLKALRKHLGLNQSGFAERIYLSQTALSMIEGGRTPLSDKNIMLICSTFNVNEKWFRTGKGAMFGTSSPNLKELIRIFDRLNPETQEFIVEMAESLLKRQEKESRKSCGEETGE